MKKILILSIATLLTFNICAQSRVLEAVEFIDKLKKESPKFHNLPLNEYFIIDLNFDGKYEVIERVNKIGNEAVGLLNAEVSTAFDYDRIFTFNNGTWIEDFDIYYNYQIVRLQHYQHWLKMIENPQFLIEDSKQLVSGNKELFRKELERLILRIDERIK